MQSWAFFICLGLEGLHNNAERFCWPRHEIPADRGIPEVTTADIKGRFVCVSEGGDSRWQKELFQLIWSSESRSDWIQEPVAVQNDQVRGVLGCRQTVCQHHREYPGKEYRTDGEFALHVRDKSALFVGMAFLNCHETGCRHVLDS